MNQLLVSSFMLLIYVLMLFLIFLYVKKYIKKNGFNNIVMFILTYTLYYIVVPFFQLFFQENRNHNTLYTILLNQIRDEEVFISTLICFILLVFILFSYHLRIKKKSEKYFNSEKLLSSQQMDFDVKKITRLCDALFIISVFSILLIIVDAGSIEAYLSLGSLTRGLDKDPTQIIKGSYLPLITASTMILVPPYLYLFLYRITNTKILKAKLLISLFFSILFLLYNQGRAPLILFILPFLITAGRKNRKSVLGLSIFFVIGVYSLSYLDALFTYFSYGYFEVKETQNYVNIFLGEFSYPFANFSLKNFLMKNFEFRLFYDYVIWPFTMIPSFLLNLVGITKENIVSISEYNTSSYANISGIQPSGGIPVDFLTFHYYQMGYFSLILSCYLTGRFIKYLDSIFEFFRGNIAMKVVLLRISFSIINILNNADFSAIIRNRLDVVFLLLIVIYIYKMQLKKLDYIVVAYNK